MSLGGIPWKFQNVSGPLCKMTKIVDQLAKRTGAVLVSELEKRNGNPRNRIYVCVLFLKVIQWNLNKLNVQFMMQNIVAKLIFPEKILFQYFEIFSCIHS